MTTIFQQIKYDHPSLAWLCDQASMGKAEYVHKIGDMAAKGEAPLTDRDPIIIVTMFGIAAGLGCSYASKDLADFLKANPEIEDSEALIEKSIQVYAQYGRLASCKAIEDITDGMDSKSEAILLENMVVEFLQQVEFLHKKLQAKAAKPNTQQTFGFLNFPNRPDSPKISLGFISQNAVA